MESTHSEIRIYAACLAAYNGGQLHGAWIDADQDAEAVMEAIQTMLAASPVAGAEEYAIHDYEGFGEVRLSEYEGIDSVCAMAAFIAEHEGLGRGVLAHFSDLEEAEVALRDHYAGCYESAEDFAREITVQTTEIPQNIAFYVDFDAMARDMLICDIFKIEIGFQETHIFWSH